MARKKHTRAPQVHPTGPLDTVEEPWKDQVRAEMKKRGWDQKDLAGKIPVSPASITNMFKPGPRQIRYKRRIEELFGWEDSSKLGQVLERIKPHWPQLSLENAEKVAGLIESLAKKP